jgi:hypothetical protein
VLPSRSGVNESRTLSSGGVTVRDTGGLQGVTDHPGTLGRPQGEYRLARADRSNVASQVGHQFARETLRCGLTVFRVGGGHGHARGFLVKRLGRDAGNLWVPKSR